MFRGSLAAMASEKRHQGFVRRFLRARGGAVAVEFAFVAFPFVLLLFGLLELALVFIVSMTLETATGDAARMIRTGEFQTSGATGKSDFQKLVCDRMMWLQSGCAGRLTVDVQTFAVDDFKSMSDSGVQDPENFNKGATCFSPGGPADVVMVRTYFEWPLFTPLLNDALVNMGDGKRLISAFASFRNEPYSNASPTGARCN
jgi:Flp pilus assembly protein TadG